MSDFDYEAAPGLVANGRLMPEPLGVECPECGSKSLIMGGCSRTLLYCPAFTDDEGRVHTHDRNTTTTSYTCRKCGIVFGVKSTGSCWCGWPENENE